MLNGLIKLKTPFFTADRKVAFYSKRFLNSYRRTLLVTQKLRYFKHINALSMNEDR